MKIFSIISGEFFRILKDELFKNSGAKKIIILIIVTNLPLPYIFVPYLTQAITIVLLFIFLKRYNWNNATDIDLGKYGKQKIFGVPLILFSILFTTALIQLVWLPYVTQLATLFLMGLFLFLTSKRVINN